MPTHHVHIRVVDGHHARVSFEDHGVSVTGTRESCNGAASIGPRAAGCLGMHTEWVHIVCRANAQQPKLFVGMILILIFAEALALYGLIGAHSLFLHVQVVLAAMPLLAHFDQLQRGLQEAVPCAVGIILASKAGQQK